MEQPRIYIERVPFLPPPKAEEPKSPSVIIIDMGIDPEDEDTPKGVTVLDISR